MRRSAYCNPVPTSHCSQQTPGTILISCCGRFGRTTYCGVPNGDELRVLRWDQVPRETQNVVDPMILVEFGLVVENPKGRASVGAHANRLPPVALVW